MKDTSVIPAALVMTASELLEHWQGHRRVTRRVIEAFPEEKLFSFSIGGMRPFSAMVYEMIGITEGGIKGLVTRKWEPTGGLMHHLGKSLPESKADLLKLWDVVTEKIDYLWPSVPPHRLLETDKVFGEYEGPVYGSLLYWIDNEIHHRGQGYVYLRSLGIEPPPFWDSQ